MTVFGAGMAAAVITLPLDGPKADVRWTLAWDAFIAALTIYAGRQRVCGSGLTRKHLAAIGPSVVLFAAALAPGTIWFADAWWWYAMWAPVVAAPALAGAYLGYRTGETVPRDASTGTGE